MTMSRVETLDERERGEVWMIWWLDDPPSLATVRQGAWLGGDFGSRDFLDPGSQFRQCRGLQIPDERDLAIANGFSSW